LRLFFAGGQTTPNNMTEIHTGETIQVEWGVMDGNGQVTECPSEHDAREYQAEHGGDLASRTTTRYTWPTGGAATKHTAS
jgi:hypothetical protein